MEFQTLVIAIVQAFTLYQVFTVKFTKYQLGMIHTAGITDGIFKWISGSHKSGTLFHRIRDIPLRRVTDYTSPLAAYPLIYHGKPFSATFQLSNLVGLGCCYSFGLGLV